MEVKFKAIKKNNKLAECLENAENENALKKKINSAKFVKSLFKSIEVYADNKLVYTSK